MTDDELATYFHDQIFLPYRDFADSFKLHSFGGEKNVRLGCTSAIALYHFREKLTGSKYGAGSVRDVLKQCDDYGVVRDIANITKHHILKNPATHVQQKDGYIHELIVLTSYKDEFGSYMDISREVNIALNRGEESLLAVLTNVINFWSRHLKKQGLENVSSHIGLSTREEPLSREKCNREMPVFELMQGITTKMTIQFRTYNYEKGLIEVDEISPDDKFSMPLYEAGNQPTVQMLLINERIDKSFSEQITLSPRDVEILKTFSTKEEAEQYVYSLPQAKTALGWLHFEMLKAEVDFDNRTNSSDKSDLTP